MTGYVLLSTKDGDVYHEIDYRGVATCGNLNPNLAIRNDINSVVIRADELETTSAADAEQRGFEPCGHCFAGGTDR